MARPPKGTETKRSRQVIFRLTEADHDLLCNHARQAGLSPNDLARSLIRKGRKRLVIETHRRCDPALLKRLDQIGHNLLQIMKNADGLGSISPLIIEQLCRTIDGLITQALEGRPDDS